jgi:ankyrin repeat protein
MALTVVRGTTDSLVPDDALVFLLKRTATINAADDDGRTALHDAVRTGKFRIATLLLDHGANIDAADAKLCTALHYAVEGGNLEIAKLLIDRGANVDAIDAANGRTPLHWAAIDGILDVATLLLDRGAKIDAADANEWTPLDCAVIRGRLDVTTLLLDRGHNIVATNTKGWTPLHCAVVDGKLDFATLLLDRGANIETATSTKGRTPLHCAVINGKLDLATLLLDRGANIDAIDYDGLTPLIISTRDEDLSMSICKLLLDRGAKIDATDSEGRTALHHAIINDGRAMNTYDMNSKFVELLLDRNNNLTEMVDIDDYTPLLMAARCGLPTHVQILLDRGANIDATDGVGRTVHRIADICGRKSVIEVLTRYTAERQTNVVAPVVGVPDNVVEEIAISDIITTVDVTPGPKRRAETVVTSPTWATKKLRSVLVKPRSSTKQFGALPVVVASAKPS